MPYVTVGKENSGEIQLYYEDHGSGDPVVIDPRVSAERRFVGEAGSRAFGSGASRHYV